MQGAGCRVQGAGYLQALEEGEVSILAIHVVWQRPRQIVGGQVQDLEPPQVAQLGRYRAAQSIVRYAQLGQLELHTCMCVCVHACMDVCTYARLCLSGAPSGQGVVGTCMHACMRVCMHACCLSGAPSGQGSSMPQPVAYSGPIELIVPSSVGRDPSRELKPRLTYWALFHRPISVGISPPISFHDRST